MVVCYVNVGRCRIDRYYYLHSLLTSSFIIHLKTGFIRYVFKSLDNSRFIE